MAKTLSKEKKQKEEGLNSKLTEENRVKVKYIAAIDGTIDEMAYFCGVSRQTIYNWFEKEPELLDDIERLRQTPIVKARETIVNKIPESYQNAIDYLKRKRREEFGDKNETTVLVKSISDVLDTIQNESK
jgi:predicted DNA-binding protein YlxM (UPF0122 family)